MSANTSWDETVDLLVVGSGAGAMTAAITAAERGGKALVIEKSDRYGGNSAMSGGGLWVPNNHLMAAAGVKDTPDEAWTYFKATTAGNVSDDRLRAYLDNAPELVKFLMERTQAKFVALPEYADYYQNLPGSKPGGRSIEPLNFNAAARPRGA